MNHNFITKNYTVRLFKIKASFDFIVGLVGLPLSGFFADQGLLEAVSADTNHRSWGLFQVFCLKCSNIHLFILDHIVNLKSDENRFLTLSSIIVIDFAKSSLSCYGNKPYFIAEDTDSRSPSLCLFITNARPVYEQPYCLHTLKQTWSCLQYCQHCHFSDPLGT